MKIDLFTFFAQIINFIILIVLLYFFLFKKIIQAIDNREEKIRSEFEEAKKEKEAAEQKRLEHEEQLQQIREEKEALKQKAQIEAREEKEKFLEKARSSIEEKKTQWEKTLELEKASFIETLREKIAQEIFSTADAVIRDLANADLQKLIFQRFLDALQALPQKQMEQFIKIYSETKKEGIEIISSFELPQEDSDKIQKVLTDILGEEPIITYLTNHHLLLGIILKVGGFQFHWTTQNYFEKLEENFEHVLAGKDV